MGECARIALRTCKARLIGVPLAALLASVSSSGCDSQPDPPHGSPVLVGVWWVTGVDRTQVWGTDPDAAVPPIPPGASEVDFVFDRRIDGSRVEDTIGGMTVPKADPPVTVSWENAATVMSDPPFADDVFYNSVALYGGQSSYVFLRPRATGFPQTTTLTFALDASGLTSAYGDPMTGPSAIAVTTDGLGVVPRTSSATNMLPTFPPTFQVPVQFTARPAAASAVTAFTHAHADGVEVPIAVSTDPVDPTLLYVSPTCAGGWPVGALVEVTFDAGLPDAFGVPTPAALAGGSFRVSGGTDAGSESACALPTDAAAE